MASIQCRTTSDGKKSYTVKVRLKGHPMRVATFERLTDARKWAAATESAIREGRHFKTTEAKRHTLADAIDRYRETRDIPHSKDTHLEWWRDKLGAYLLADITAARITECRDELAGGSYHRHGAKTEQKRSPATCNRYFTALSHVLSVAVREWEWLETNPAGKVKKLKEPPGRVRFLSDDERRRLLEACKESRAPCLYLLVVLALSTGARYSELMTLEWRQVDLKRGAIRLEKTKNGERRALPLKGLALELMTQHARVRRLDTPLCFPGKTDPVTGGTKPLGVRQGFYNALQRAGIDDFRWHDLRHSAASYLAMNGASLAEISEVLGHKQLSMVKRYAHLSDGHVAGVVERMNNAVFDKAGG